MPFPMDPLKYPPEFAALYRRALKEPFEVDLLDRGIAANYCHRLHAYRRAVETMQPANSFGLRTIIISQRGTRIIFGSSAGAMEAIRSAAGIHMPSDQELDDYLAQLEQGTDDGKLGTDVQQPSGGEQEAPEVEVETDYLKLFQEEPGEET